MIEVAMAGAAKNTTISQPVKAAPRKYGAPTATDILIGKRMRQRRLLLGKSQEDVALGLGVAFQQVQKYEAALNRISTARLWTLATILKCPIAYFYSDADDSDGGISRLIRPAAEGENSVALTAETLKLIRSFSTIKSTETRNRILSLARSLAGEPDASDASHDEINLERASPSFSPTRNPIPAAMAAAL